MPIGGRTGPAEGSAAATITPGDWYLAVAAAVALPARGQEVPSVQRIVATVAGTLDLRLEPTVVAAGAHPVTTLVAVLTGKPGCRPPAAGRMGGDRLGGAAAPGHRGAAGPRRAG
ncbi:MAG: urease accessory protein [Frankiales bacterium]|nr:urease accessory protein [Frankiales bacterium]